MSNPILQINQVLKQLIWQACVELAKALRN
jgi:hypothetical protein